jgi:hypothetical protein
MNVGPAAECHPQRATRPWLFVLADLGPELVKAAVELPSGSLDVLFEGAKP